MVNGCIAANNPVVHEECCADTAVGYSAAEAFAAGGCAVVFYNRVAGYRKSRACVVYPAAGSRVVIVGSDVSGNGYVPQYRFSMAVKQTSPVAKAALSNTG
ncbi:hypothetical protein Barb7_02823 [Bacteroidales bacterium Barb7]|nr:hypothetical protein Barb7_02823 [Bacteroidales bacterium Barb7]